MSKGLIFAGVTRAFGYRNVVPLASALGLFGIGEFSFVLARTGPAAGAIPASLYALVLNTAVITMVLTPVVSGLTTPIYGWMSRRRAREPVQTINVPDSALAGHVVVAGAGRVGCRIAEVLQSLQPAVRRHRTRSPPDRSREGARAIPTIFGDAAQPVVLEAAGIARARLLLVTTPVLGVSRAVVEHARRINPAVDVVVRAESADAMASFQRDGRGRSRAAGPRGEPGDDAAGARAPAHVRARHRPPDRPAARRRSTAERRPGRPARDHAVVATLGAAARLLDLRWIRILEGSLLAGRTHRRGRRADVAERDHRRHRQRRPAHREPGPGHVLRAGDIVAVVGDQQHVDGFEVAAGN